MVLNLLPIAMQATNILGCNQPILYYQYDRTVTDSMGRDIPQYLDPIPLQASVQAVDNKTYQELGLDLNKHYKSIWAEHPMFSIAERKQPDKIIYNNMTFILVSNTNWSETNGYTQALMVQVDKDELLNT